ncbi:MAG: hypothetical protein U0169_08620 [Polyangiaceae bacterium]
MTFFPDWFPRVVPALSVLAMTWSFVAEADAQTKGAPTNGGSVTRAPRTRSGEEPEEPIDVIPPIGAEPTARPRPKAPATGNQGTPANAGATANGRTDARVRNGDDVVGTIPPEDSNTPASRPKRTATEPTEEPSEDAPSGAGFAKTRFRWGIAPAGGVLLANGLAYAGGGLDLRFGAQITEKFGLYAQPTLLFATASSGGTTVGALLAGTAVVADVTLADTLLLGAGPEILAAGVAAGPAGATAVPVFSVATRAAVVLGPKRADKRHGFMIGADVRFLFAGGTPFVAPMLGIGYETF